MKNLNFLGLSKYSLLETGEIYSLYSKRFLKKIFGDDGYYKVNLVNDSGITEYWRFARLMAYCFYGNPPEGYVVNHKDGNKLNDCVTNLEWVTPSENTNHAILTGLQTTAGEYQITDLDTIHEICRMLEEGYRKKDISEVLDVPLRKVTEIQNKTSWSSISDEYDINYVKRNDRLSPEKVLSICRDLEAGYNLKQTSDRNSCSTSAVHRIRQRKSYSDISKNFKW